MKTDWGKLNSFFHRYVLTPAVLHLYHLQILVKKDLPFIPSQHVEREREREHVKLRLHSSMGRCLSSFFTGGIGGKKIWWWELTWSANTTGFVFLLLIYTSIASIWGKAALITVIWASEMLLKRLEKHGWGHKVHFVCFIFLNVQHHKVTHNLMLGVELLKLLLL